MHPCNSTIPPGCCLQVRLWQALCVLSPLVPAHEADTGGQGGKRITSEQHMLASLHKAGFTMLSLHLLAA